MTTLTPPKVPCGSCPYRKDVPAGIWAAEEYAKLPGYDGPTWQQTPQVFQCHQQDGHLCGGWLMTHDPYELLALRLARSIGYQIDPAVYDYSPDVEVFASGAQAALHGISGIENPSPAARRKIDGLVRQKERRG